METRQLYHRVTESRQAILEVLVSTLEARDEGTAGHSRRVVYYALRLASELGVDEVMMPSIGWGSLLHDIGKIAVPDSILRKRGPLTEEEWQVMRTHCEVGYSLVSKIKPLKTATEIVRYHHERWDGTGYPFGLEREAIPLSARIFAVVDTLDAVTSPRPYRPIPHTFEQALVELKRHSGTQFDPAVVEAAVRIGAAGWARSAARSVGGGYPRPGPADWRGERRGSRRLPAVGSLGKPGEDAKLSKGLAQGDRPAPLGVLLRDAGPFSFVRQLAVALVGEVFGEVFVVQIHGGHLLDCNRLRRARGKKEATSRSVESVKTREPRASPRLQLTHRRVQGLRD